MEYVYLGLILLWFALGVWFSMKLVRKASAKWAMWFLLTPALLVGVVLGRWFADHEYYVSPDLRFLGFPLPVAAFERIHDESWRDFVSGWWPIFLIVNFILGLMVPIIVIGVVMTLKGWMSRRRTAVK